MEKRPPSHECAADALTKALGPRLFLRFKRFLMGHQSEDSSGAGHQDKAAACGYVEMCWRAVSSSSTGDGDGAEVATAAAQKRRAEVLTTKARRLFEDGARASRRPRAVKCSGRRRGNRASEVEVGLLGLPRQNIEPSSLQEKLHVDLTGQGSRGKRHRGKAESPETPSAGPVCRGELSDRP